MTIKVITLLATVFVICYSRDNREQIKLTKLTCASGNVSFVKRVCYTRPIGPRTFIIKLEADIIQQVDKLNFDVKLEYRALGNYRDIISIRNIDYCLEASQGFGYNPLYYKIFQFAKEYTKGMVHECPYKPGRMHFNLTEEASSKIEEMANYNNGFIPSGDYIASVRIYDGKDYATLSGYITLKFIDGGPEF